MSNVTLNIHGHPYNLHCDDGEEGELHRLAEELSERLAGLDHSFGERAETLSAQNMRLVIAGLMLLAELRETKQYTRRKTSQNREEVEEIIADTLERIAGKLEKLAA